MRVTSNMSYYMLLGNMSRLQESYHATMEKIATQKRINRPSDDPLGMVKVIDYKDVRKSVEQYKTNINVGTSWLSTAAATLQNIDDTIGKIKSIAISYVSSNPHTQDTFKDEVKDLTEQIYAFANNTFLGQYLFSGSRTETKPFTDTPQAAQLEPAGASGSNSYTGTVTEGGTFTGTTNQTYIVRIVNDGPVSSADYQLSSDGGKTWGAVSNVWSGTDIELDSSGPVTISFSAGTVFAGDAFFVEARAAGYYQGDDISRDVKIGPNTAMSYAIPGSQIFLPVNGIGVDLFQVLDDLQAAMASNNEAAVNAAIQDLSVGRQQVQHGLASIGIKDIRFKVAENHLTLLDKTMADLVDKTESSDIEALAMLLAMEKISLDATYSMAAKMQQTTILNFLR